MKVGHEFTSRGQRFRCVGSEDYLTLRGEWIELIKLEAACADCRRSFSLKAAMTAIRRANLKRRCDRCKSPGVATHATKALQQKRAVKLVAQDQAAQKAVRNATRPLPRPRRGHAAVKLSTVVERSAEVHMRAIPTKAKMFS